MANVLNRTTKQFLRSVNTPDYSSIDWIINPDLSGVFLHPIKYWLINGNDVTLMDQAAREALDVAENNDRLDNIANELDRNETIMRAFTEVVLDEINSLRSQHSLTARTLQQLKTAVRSKL